MVNPNLLLKTLKENKIDTFCGVADSVLKNFLDEIEDDSSIKKNHYLCVNEGSAVSFAIGNYLSKKKSSCVYFQNSGLGNAINPLISIADKNVYSIPIILLIGWRGAPNIHDEPQHISQGKITLKQLKLLNINYLVIDKDKELKKIKNIISFSKKKKVPVAILIRKGFLKAPKNKKIIITNNKEIVQRSHFLEYLLGQLSPKDKIVSTTGYASRELNQIRKNKKIFQDKDFYVVGGMGHANSISLGLSVKSKSRVICIDGDGSLLMHMGSIFSSAYYAKKNYKYIILNNSMHESTGGQKTFANRINFKKLSDALGFKNYFLIKNKKKFNLLNKFLRLDGPNFLEVKIHRGSIENLSRPKNLKKYF